MKIGKLRLLNNFDNIKSVKVDKIQGECMKKIVSGLITLLILGGGMVVFAQTTTPRLLERIRERPRISTQEFQQNREEIQRQIEQIRAEYRKQIQEKREEMKAKIEALKEQLRTKLRERISERKRAIVERIYDRINALNERMTDHYMDVLDHLEKVLERIESRTAKAELNGRDVSKVKEAIEKAHEAIEKARKAVKAQAEKVYQPPEITTEEKLKLDVGKLRQQLHDDLKAVEKLVKDARDAVRQAAVALAQIPKVDELEVPTTTETTTQPTQ
jgi:DNA repair exonuclease SbcCD ATPase subunit